MKRRDLLSHLVEHGCQLVREGARHSVFYNPQKNATSTIPRHREINEFLARKICRDPGVPRPS
ncbi:MAG: type II toxin-antitoxin system HicA family toxin [Candidatus Acidiferrales bacterium]